MLFNKNILSAVAIKCHCKRHVNNTVCLVTRHGRAGIWHHWCQICHIRLFVLKKSSLYWACHCFFLSIFMFVIYLHFCENCALSSNIFIFPPLLFWLSLLSEKCKTSKREDQCFQIFPEEGTLRPTCSSTSPTQGQRGQQAGSSPCARCSWRGWDPMWWPRWSE